MGLKLKIQIGIIIALLLGFWYASKNYTVVKAKVIEDYEATAKKDSVSVVALSKELEKRDSIIFDLQQSVDINSKNVGDFQTVIKGLKNELKACKENDNSCCAELKHLEETENIRYFVKKPLSKWFEEVKKKPLYIKK